MPEYTPEGIKIPKVYTSSYAAIDALDAAGLTYTGYVGGLLNLQTKDGIGTFLVPVKTTSTALVCLVRAFEAGIRYAQHRSADAFEAAGKNLPVDAPTPIIGHLYEIRVHDIFFYATASHKELALDKFAHMNGYDCFADLLADPRMPEEAEEVTHIRVTTYRDAVHFIVREAYASPVFSDERHNGNFRSSGEWAIWHLQGETGERCKRFAKDFRLDFVRVWDAVDEGLRRRPIQEIHAAMYRAGRA